MVFKKKKGNTQERNVTKSGSSKANTDLKLGVPGNLIGRGSFGNSFAGTRGFPEDASYSDVQTAPRGTAMQPRPNLGNYYRGNSTEFSTVKKTGRRIQFYTKCIRIYQ